MDRKSSKDGCSLMDTVVKPGTPHVFSALFEHLRFIWTFMVHMKTFSEGDY